MKKSIKERKTFRHPINTHFHIEEHETDEPQSMPNFHYHNIYELYYLRRGERYYFINDSTYAVRAGSFVLVDKNAIHCTGTLNNAGYDRVLLYFDDSFLKSILDTEDRGDLLNCFGRSHGAVELSRDGRGMAEALLTSMLAEYNGKPDGQDICVKAALIQLLCLISREGERNTKSGDTKLGAPQNITANIIGYINNNYFEDITLEFLSEQFYVSPYYLSRTFKSVCGISFVDYLNNVRVKEAAKLLANTDMSITEICTAVGYKSNTHFGRTFKKIMGVSPREYRKI